MVEKPSMERIVTINRADGTLHYGVTNDGLVYEISIRQQGETIIINAIHDRQDDPAIIATVRNATYRD